VRVLTEPKNSLVKQYMRMFSFEDAQLTFTDSGLKEIAREAIAHKTGARGLRSICERTLLETMYDLPTNDAIAEVVVTAEAVRGEQKPTVVLRTSKSSKSSKKASA
jgi:ATP-dependent Clp protease ATP-binding subunit ClpX